MQATVVIQKHPDGQTNVCLSNDPLLDIDDLLVKGGGWDQGKVITGKLILIGDSEIVDTILGTELRSVNNVEQLVPTLQISDDTFRLLHGGL